MADPTPGTNRGRKVLRYFVGFLVVILTVYVLAKSADWIWFRTKMPVGLVDANWSGKWGSHEYWLISGDLLVHLPDPLPENADFQAEALVYYPIYSPWQTGQFVRMDFRGHFSPDEPTAGHSTNAIPGGGLKFKGKVGNQVVEYVATIEEGGACIAGQYTSTSPYDAGYFYITKP